MGWKIYAKPYENGSDLTDTTISQEFVPQDNFILRAVKAVILIVDDPTFTSLNGKIYGNDENAENPSPSTLLATSTNTQPKGDLISQNSAWVETYFLFDDLLTRKDVSYHFVINATGYSPSGGAHIAWKHAYPDPFNETRAVDTGVPTDFELITADLAQFPMECYFYGAQQ